MSANTFHLVIASVGDTKFDAAAESATLPGVDGIMTILPHHEPFVTILKKGKVSVKASGEHKEFDIEGGVLECSGNRAVVLL
ncbi:F0F1 ATP synthase subunit epsilon [Candidatus Parcubacteria bacterium]|nr:MAG: F0F1 ATP synthase subunit epsilon [Candidatus Parcubacteria bacterium]